MELAVETTNLTKRYGSLLAVNKLNLKVAKGSIHGFLGPNGAGKTTTIKMLVGLLKPDEGSAKVLGHELHEVPQGFSQKLMVALREHADSRLRIGYMPELPKFPKHLKGWEVLDIYGRMYGMTEQQRKEQIPKLIDLVGLKGRENDQLGKYSKGMQQRIGIAQALLNDPELVILDEPSLGLDPVGMVDVRELVKNIAKEGMTVLFSSHLLYEVQQVCTHVTIINKGTLLVSDTLQNVSNMLTEEGAVIQVELAQFVEAAGLAVKALPFVSSVIRNGNVLGIYLNTHDDVRAQVSQTVTGAGGVIVGMSQKGSNLEDVFLQLITKGNAGEKKQ